MKWDKDIKGTQLEMTVSEAFEILNQALGYGSDSKTAKRYISHQLGLMEIDTADVYRKLQDGVPNGIILEELNEELKKQN